MKKTVLLFTVAAMVLLASVIWTYTSFRIQGTSDIIQFGIIILLVGFAVFVGFKRWGNLKRGEPAEDESSKKVLQKASSLSYYISLYLWLVLIYISDRTKLETDAILGAGILGMAVIFALCWGVISLRGIRNA
jgi:peptidoglycan/LPS O-acetylase OafA/YrhL